MWDFMTNLMSNRKGNNSGTMTAMIVGAGIGIAAWEMLKRNNALDSVTQRMRKGSESSSHDNDQQS